MGRPMFQLDQWSLCIHVHNVCVHVHVHAWSAHCIMIVCVCECVCDVHAVLLVYCNKIEHTDCESQAIVLVVGIGTWAATSGDNINRATQC